MPLRTVSLCWIEDQLDEFIDGGWDVLTTELEKLGLTLDRARPTPVNTVEEAERRLSEYDEGIAQRPDIILLDLMLPQDDEDLRERRVDLDAGYLIWSEIRHLRNWPSLANLPIVVITARGRPEYMDQMLKDVDGTRWLPKPASPVALAETIRQLMNSAEPRQATTPASPAGGGQ